MQSVTLRKFNYFTVLLKTFFEIQSSRLPNVIIQLHCTNITEGHKHSVFYHRIQKQQPEIKKQSESHVIR